MTAINHALRQCFRGFIFSKNSNFFVLHCVVPSISKQLLHFLSYILSYSTSFQHFQNLHGQFFTAKWTPTCSVDGYQSLYPNNFLHINEIANKQLYFYSTLQTSLPRESEIELAECLTIKARWGYASTREKVKELVEQNVKENKDKENAIEEHLRKYCQFKDGKPGEDWLCTFMNKYGLSSKKPSSLKKKQKNSSFESKYHLWVSTGYSQLSNLLLAKLI